MTLERRFWAVSKAISWKVFRRPEAATCKELILFRLGGRSWTSVHFDKLFIFKRSLLTDLMITSRHKYWRSCYFCLCEDWLSRILGLTLISFKILTVQFWSCSIYLIDFTFINLINQFQLLLRSSEEASNHEFLNSFLTVSTTTNWKYAWASELFWRHQHAVQHWSLYGNELCDPTRCDPDRQSRREEKRREEEKTKKAKEKEKI